MGSVRARSQHGPTPLLLGTIDLERGRTGLSVGARSSVGTRPEELGGDAREVAVPSTRACVVPISLPLDWHRTLARRCAWGLAAAFRVPRSTVEPADPRYPARPLPDAPVAFWA
jgi:hypothetical protein